MTRKIWENRGYDSEEVGEMSFSLVVIMEEKPGSHSAGFWWTQPRIPAAASVDSGRIGVSACDVCSISEEILFTLRGKNSEPNHGGQRSEAAPLQAGMENLLRCFKVNLDAKLPMDQKYK